MAYPVKYTIATLATLHSITASAVRTQLQAIYPNRVFAPNNVEYLSEEDCTMIAAVHA